MTNLNLPEQPVVMINGQPVNIVSVNGVAVNNDIVAGDTVSVDIESYFPKDPIEINFSRQRVGPYREGDIINRPSDIPRIFRESVRGKWHTYSGTENSWMMQPSSTNFPIKLTEIETAFGSANELDRIESDLFHKTVMGLRLGDMFNYEDFFPFMEEMNKFHFDFSELTAWYRRRCNEPEGEYCHLMPTADDFPIRLIRFCEPLVVLDSMGTFFTYAYRHPLKKYLDHFLAQGHIFYVVPCRDNHFAVMKYVAQRGAVDPIRDIEKVKILYDSGVPVFIHEEHAVIYANEQKGVDHYV